jgi:phosphoribosyl-ATP pyrophosphohydrolase
MSSALHDLMSVIEERKANPGQHSYTANLLAAGLSKICEKVSEEAGEVIEAAAEPGEEGRQHLVRETADLLYHLLVLLALRGVSLAEVEAELDRRSGVSGLDEKASRKSP